MEQHISIRRGMHKSNMSAAVRPAQQPHHHCYAVQVFALGFVSVFDQIVEGLPGSGASDIFEAYVKALKEDPEQYRRCRHSPPVRPQDCSVYMLACSTTWHANVVFNDWPNQPLHSSSYTNNVSTPELHSCHNHRTTWHIAGKGFVS